MSPRRPITQIIRWLTQLLPRGYPHIVYRSLAKVPGLNHLTNWALLSLLPPYLTINGVTVALNTSDPVISGALILGVYEPLETKLFTSHIRPGWVVVDVGANTGYYTALAARAVGPTGRVIAIEPEPENFTLLQKTASCSSPTNISCYQTALSRVTGKAELFLSATNKGDHRLAPLPGAHRESININATSLDALVFTHNLPLPNLIKMDIQGAEGLALDGMVDTIKQQDQLILFTEFWPAGLQAIGYSPAGFLSKLTSLGFSLTEIDEVGGVLRPITNVTDLIHRLTEKQYTNLLCCKGITAESA